jgi:fatty acid desaturase
MGGKKPNDFLLKFIKFSLVGTVCFLITTWFFGALAPYYGYWTGWLIANGVGGVLGFFIYYYKVNIHQSGD